MIPGSELITRLKTQSHSLHQHHLPPSCALALTLQVAAIPGQEGYRLGDPVGDTTSEKLSALLLGSQLWL